MRAFSLDRRSRIVWSLVGIGQTDMIYIGRDNGSDHRVRTIDLPFQTTRKPDFACITLILIMASLSDAVCPLPLIVTYVLADVSPQLDL